MSKVIIILSAISMLFLMPIAAFQLPQSWKFIKFLLRKAPKTTNNLETRMSQLGILNMNKYFWAAYIAFTFLGFFFIFKLTDFPNDSNHEFLSNILRSLLMVSLANCFNNLTIFALVIRGDFWEVRKFLLLDLKIIPIYFFPFILTLPLVMILYSLIK